MKSWLEQVVWFLAGNLATGALWYFLSTNHAGLAAIAALGTLALVGLAIWLHNLAQNPLHDPIVLHADEERITFDELVRTSDFDVIRILAHDHVAGIASEYEWVRRRYPDAEVILQAHWDLPGSDETVPRASFDMLRLQFADGRTKDVQFDITAFFQNSNMSGPPPGERVLGVIASLYADKST